MVKTNPQKLIKILNQNIYDYCLLLPMLKENHIMTIEECYVSEKNMNNFLCFECNYDGTKSLEIHSGQKDTTEIIELLICMKNKNYFRDGCTVCLYKSKDLLNYITNVCNVSKVENLTSYYSNVPNDYYIPGIENSCVFVIDEKVSLENSFVVQKGNHIKLIQKQLNDNSKNNQIIYLQTNNRVIGYIALSQQYGNIWDVSFIFIDERYRNKGYATLLCKKARQLLYNQKRVLYYSYCENNISERVAQKSGLLPCAERDIFYTNFEGLGE